MLTLPQLGESSPTNMDEELRKQQMLHSLISPQLYQNSMTGAPGNFTDPNSLPLTNGQLKYDNSFKLNLSPAEPKEEDIKNMDSAFIKKAFKSGSKIYEPFLNAINMKDKEEYLDKIKEFNANKELQNQKSTTTPISNSPTSTMDYSQDPNQAFNQLSNYSGQRIYKNPQIDAGKFGVDFTAQTRAKSPLNEMLYSAIETNEKMPYFPNLKTLMMKKS